MYKPFENISDQARVWIYQSNRELTAGEVEFVEANARKFTDQWAAHGTPLHTSCLVKYNRFLILAADEEVHKASGCSIDSSMHFIQALEAELKLSFTDRLHVVFLKDEEAVGMHVTGISEAVKEGKIDENAITFNNLVPSKGELLTNWKVRAGDTWLKKYFTSHKQIA